MPISKDQKEQLLRLLEQDLSEIDLLDQAGQVLYGKPYEELSPAQRAWVTMRLARTGPNGDVGIEQAIQTTFGLERDLQNALLYDDNIEQLERGLKAIEKECKVDSGFIDILAQDKTGTSVVIELKAGEASRETIGQIFGYMGDLQRTLNKAVRGIIVAGDFHPAVISALSALPNLQLRKYSFKFSFEAVGAEKEITRVVAAE